MTPQQKASRRSQSVKVLAVLKSIAHKGGLAGGAKRRAEAAVRWRQEARELSPGQIAAKFYRRGYNNGYMTGARKGYSDGYEQALKDMHQAGPGAGTEGRMTISIQSRPVSYCESIERARACVCGSVVTRPEVCPAQWGGGCPFQPQRPGRAASHFGMVLARPDQETCE